MDEKNEVQDHSPAPVGAEFEDHEQRKLLTRAFASLRLLGLRGGAASVNQAVAQARRNAEKYKEWKNSGTPIKDVVMKLSDGEEIEVKRTLVTGLCGFRFVRKFTQGEVIHLFKKADKYYDEVLLLSVNVDQIEADGYVWENEYANKQTVQLSIQPCADGQLHVSVDYTPARGDKAKIATTVLHSILPGFALLSDLNFWNRKTYRQSWQPSKGFAVALLGAVALLISMHYQKGADNAAESQKVAPEEVKQESTKSSDETGKGNSLVVQGAQTLPSHNTAVEPNTHDRKRETGNSRQNANWNKEAITEPTSTEGNKTLNQTGATWSVCEVNLNSNHNNNITAPRMLAVKPPQGRALIVQPAIKAPNAIYIKAFVPNDRELTTAIETSFVGALREKSSFRVLTEADERNGIPPDAYWVDLWFSQKPGCTGTIQAVLRTGSNQIAWVGERDCHKYPDGELIKRASVELVAEMVSKFEEAQKGD